MSFAPGCRVGPYEIISLLGNGGMGDVFLARDTRLQRRVALKVIRGAALGHERDRSLQEARAASRVVHPNIVVIYDVGEDAGRPFIAMEYVEGQPLTERLRTGSLPQHDVVRIGIQVADALRAAHATGIVHRDVKPANVMVTSSGVVKVVDFGLARLDAVDPAAVDGRTQLATYSGVVMGTVAYMSPEQTVPGPVDTRSDLFSLGIVMYEAATGRLPFAGSSGVETIERIRQTEPEAISGFNPGISGELARIIRKCLAKHPDLRYLCVWQQRCAEAGERTAAQERRVKAVRQKHDRLDEAFLYSESIDLATYSRQRDRLREELTLSKIDHPPRPSTNSTWKASWRLQSAAYPR